MGYWIVLYSHPPVTEELLAEFKATVPAYKQTGLTLYSKMDARHEPGKMVLHGSWSDWADDAQCHKIRSYGHRMIRWFAKMRNIQVSAAGFGNELI